MLMSKSRGMARLLACLLYNGLDMMAGGGGGGWAAADGVWADHLPRKCVEMNIP
jgi:hypothetical protein